MARFFGKVGFIRTEETDPENHPGAWRPIITEREYYGDMIRNTHRWDQNGNSTNDNLVLNNTISIVADSFAEENAGAMKYVRLYGERWKITNIEQQRPRLLLTVGGLYNGPES
jgi:hypothetical protein